ncbi:MAG: hypothetical protein PHU70_04685 [Dehalococcoidia bacterium]|nr:hypothetical protein [Dehalococcoidia bacterium]MDD5648112.1 hypothetical protein [Dehalococcoidia bacterium]
MAEAKKRYFAQSELKEMGEETVKLVQQAIDAGELEKAKKLNRRMYREFASQHDNYLNWVTSLLTFIQNRLGDEAVYESIYGAFEALGALADAYRGQDPGKQAAMLAAGFRGHLTSAVVEEDDEKFTVMMAPCGSGGKIVANNGYAPTGKFAKLKKPHKMTFGKADFPIYCAHCALQDIVPMEKTGYPIWVMETPDKVGEVPCKYYIYKNPDDIPARFYERYGLKKPPVKSKK